MRRKFNGREKENEIKNNEYKILDELNAEKFDRVLLRASEREYSSQRIRDCGNEIMIALESRTKMSNLLRL